MNLMKQGMLRHSYYLFFIKFYLINYCYFILNRTNEYDVGKPVYSEMYGSFKLFYRCLYLCVWLVMNLGFFYYFKGRCIRSTQRRTSTIKLCNVLETKIENIDLNMWLYFYKSAKYYFDYFVGLPSRLVCNRKFFFQFSIECFLSLF